MRVSLLFPVRYDIVKVSNTLLLKLLNYKEQNHNMRKFGDFSELNESDTQKINFLIEKIEMQRIDCTLFYGFPLIELDNSLIIMKGCLISTKGIIILHDSDIDKKVYWRHITKTIMECPSISEKVMDPSVTLITFYHCDNIDEILHTLGQAHADILSDCDVEMLIAVIQKAYNLSKFDSRIIKTHDSLGDIIKKRNNKINTLDEEQFRTIYKSQSGHVRIRGLAGSGKTILLVKKMAYLHYRNPELKINYVFYTISLKQFIERLFRSFYKEFNPYGEPDMSKISILHSWGNKYIDGFYSTICKRFNVERKTLKDVAGESDKLGAVCKDLMEKLKKQDIGICDYIFIDEAQDFSLDFFKLALKALKPTGKLIYAYDELQSLNAETNMPTKYSIFGKRKCEDINLPICYRTPKEILVTAHALGLGIYKKKEDGSSDLVNMIQDVDTWSAIGYEVSEGQLALGKAVTLERRDVIEEKCSDCVIILEKSNEIEQYEYVRDEILDLMTNQDVTPDDIMIIDLDSISLNDDFLRFRRVITEKTWDAANHSWIFEVNLVNKDNAVKFRISDSIPYTTIFRAKGNEANIVFILNAHKLQSISTYARNRIFTAMTRARFKVYLLGTSNMQTFIDEADSVKDQNYRLSFVYPTKDELQKMSTIAKTEIKSAKESELFIDLFKNLKSNPALLKELLVEQLGTSSIEEFLETMRESDIDE